MTDARYKKMAGTSAVFILDSYEGASPVERDGLSWSAEELHLQDLPSDQNNKPAMANVLALEGLEDYEPPENGDARRVESLDTNFIYFEKIRGWIQVA